MDKNYIASQICAIYNCPIEYLETVEYSLWRIAANANLFWDSETQTNCLSEYGVLTDSQREQVWLFIEEFDVEDEMVALETTFRR